MLSPGYRNGWKRPAISAQGVLSLETVIDSEVSEQYFNVPGSTVAAFLDCSGGAIIPADVIPDPYPPLTFADFSVAVVAGQMPRVRVDLESIGGRPPLTYSLEDAAAALRMLVAGTEMVVITPADAAVGEHTARVRVTDSLGATADATATITVTPAP